MDLYEGSREELERPRWPKMAPRPPRRAQDGLQHCSTYPEPQDGPHVVPIGPNAALRRLQVANELTKEAPKMQHSFPKKKGRHCVLMSCRFASGGFPRPQGGSNMPIIGP
eukprot:446007-Pyramimonas_sp.AAC.1